jgi:hypothetical protein
MSLPRTKRVKHINPDGTEEFQDEDSWALVRAVHTQQVMKGAKNPLQPRLTVQTSMQALCQSNSCDSELSYGVAGEWW